jgi:hypothetical protein
VRKLFTRHLFFLLLPLFFVLNGWLRNREFIPVADAGILLLVYVAAAIVLYAVSWLILRSPAKAALASFVLLFIHFFFGSFHDGLKQWFGESFVTKYSVLLPLLLIIIIATFVWLKKRKSLLLKPTIYLNLLLVLLILVDSIRALLPLLQSKTAVTVEYKTAPQNIYLIVLDEYAGQDALKELFGYDNSPFFDQLKQRGFHVVPHSRSNYNYTPFSMASILNMQYLQLKDTGRLKPDVVQALRMIHNNEVVRMLQPRNDIYNFSVFDMQGRPSPVDESFIPSKTRLITSQTLLSRLYRDLGYHLGATFKIKMVIKSQDYRELRNNNLLYNLTWKQAAAPHNKPQFIYTHLMMPHYPYYFDRNGKPMDPARILPEGNNVNRQDYVEYLQYVNKKILALCDHILKSSSAPPVIILLSDHGFRHFREPVDKKYHFINLNAVYLPGQRYNAFYDSVSNVNTFRIVFNEVFKTELEVLKDSSVYLKD